MTVQSASKESWPAQSQQLGKYQLVATLGQGGMGTVYLALASGFGQFRKLLVVKELRQDLTRQNGFVSMFMDEAKLAARLAHPNVVQTFEACEVGDRYCLAMEFLDGQSLFALLERVARTPSVKLTLWMQLQILCDALSGLHYAHELLDYDGSSLQVVHRDVSPQNVFITYHGQVKVVDFGVAKVANASAKTASGVFIGKFSYAAPEQVTGGPVDARTDVFAAGVMLWQAIAGRPFSGRSPTPEACRARSEGLEPRIAQVVPNVDPLLARISNRALAVDPNQRFASAKEFRSELQAYMRHSGVRVESSEIGQLMHELFDTERRSMHTRIEQAMRLGPSESAIEELVIADRTDKEPTAVADLSSLVEVSLERDDQKIRQGYAHSKITLVRSGEQEAWFRMPTFAHMPHRRLLAITTVGLAAIVGVLTAIFESPGQGPAEVETSRLSASSLPTPPPAPSPSVSPTPPARKREPPESFTRSPELDFLTPAPNPLVLTPGEGSGRNAQKPVAAGPSKRQKTRVAPTRASTPPREPSDQETDHVFVVEPVPSSRPYEEGDDLLIGRRSPGVRIDPENPYP